MRLFRCVGFYFLILFALTFSFIPGYSYSQRLQHMPLVKAFQTSEGVYKDILIHDYPELVTGIEVPETTAEGIFVLDVDSGVTIYEKNSRLSLYPASATKIMTALVALEYFNQDDILKVDDAEFYPAVMGLEPGEEISFINILHGLLIPSGNDAAHAIASNYPGGYDAFVQRMNEKADEIGLRDTSFLNPSGLNQEGHITSAWDLGQMTAVALRNELFAEIVQKRAVTVYGTEGEKHILKTTNRLLGEVRGVKGVKTGFTQEAGEVLVTLAERNSRRVLVVVLKSQDRFGETRSLIEWVFNNFEWKPFSYSSM